VFYFVFRTMETIGFFIDQPFDAFGAITKRAIDK
jgi:hypothetical protein